MTNSDPGLGSSYSKEVKRLVNSDGSYNIVRHGALRGFRDTYKYLIELSWWKFLLFTVLYYVMVNVIFAVLYLIAGPENISGTDPQINDFMEMFFFSVQTFTSVGYGYMAPTGMATNLVVTLESFAGLMSIALMTGLLYGRFSRPKSMLAFSKKILLAPFQDGEALMFKVVNKRDDILLNASVKMILIMDRGTGAEQFNKLYYQLDLQLDRINFFPLTWTVVHPINETSPVKGLRPADLIARNTEILILIEAYDETHGQMVVEKHSYGKDDWQEGVKFDRNFRVNEDGTIELFIDELDKTTSSSLDIK